MTPSPTSPAPTAGHSAPGVTSGPVADAPLILAAPVVLAAPNGVTAHSAPNDLDLDAIAATLRTSHVFTETPDQLPELTKTVDQARAQGHDINVVVLAERQPKFTMYRDIATELQYQVGGTVLVFGPNSAGSSSDEFSRVTLEEATDNLKLSKPTVAVKQMVDSITTPGIDWTGVTLVLIVIVVIGAVIARLRSRRRRTPAQTPKTTPVGAGPAIPTGTTPTGTTATDAPVEDGTDHAQ